MRICRSREESLGWFRPCETAPLHRFWPDGTGREPPGTALRRLQPANRGQRLSG